MKISFFERDYGGSVNNQRRVAFQERVKKTGTVIFHTWDDLKNNIEHMDILFFHGNDVSELCNTDINGVSVWKNEIAGKILIKFGGYKSVIPVWENLKGDYHLDYINYQDLDKNLDFTIDRLSKLKDFDISTVIQVVWHRIQIVEYFIKLNNFIFDEKLKGNAISRSFLDAVKLKDKRLSNIVDAIPIAIRKDEAKIINYISSEIIKYGG